MFQVFFDVKLCL